MQKTTFNTFLKLKHFTKCLQNARPLRLPGGRTFQQENDPKDTAKETMECIQKKMTGMAWSTPLLKHWESEFNKEILET